MPFWKLHNDPHAPPLPGGCVGLSPNRRFDLTIVQLRASMVNGLLTGAAITWDDEQHLPGIMGQLLIPVKP